MALLLAMVRGFSVEAGDWRFLPTIEPQMSSIVIEAIRGFNFFFFYKKILHAQKSIKSKQVNKILSF